MEREGGESGTEGDVAEHRSECSKQTALNALKSDGVNVFGGSEKILM